MLLVSSALSVYLVAVGFYLAELFADPLNLRGLAIAYLLMSGVTYLFAASLAFMYPYFREASGRDAQPKQQFWWGAYIGGEAAALSAVVAAGVGMTLLAAAFLATGATLIRLSLRAR